VTSTISRYAASSALLALGAALLLLPVAWARGETALRWGGAGFGATAVIGVVGGAWLRARHGGSGRGFLVAWGSCLLARLVVLGVGTLAAAGRGSEAAVAYLAGLLAGYLAPQLREFVWLLRTARN